MEDNELEELSRNVDAFSKAKLMYAARKVDPSDLNFLLEDLRIAIRDSGDIQVSIDALKNGMALRNVDFDEIITSDMLEKLNKRIDNEEFYKSDFFKTIVNGYYERIDESQKKAFVRNLGDWSDLDLQILIAIGDEKKYEEIDSNFQKALLGKDLIDEPNIKMKFLMNIYLERPYDYFISSYIGELKEKEDFNGFNLTNEEIESVIAKIESAKDSDNSSYKFHSIDAEFNGIALYSVISKDLRISYLKNKPQHIGNMIDSLEMNEIAELFESIDDSAYKARLLLSSRSNLSDILPNMKYIDDYYIESQVVLAKHKDNIQSTERALEKIKRYSDIRDKLLSLPMEERADYLINARYQISENDLQDIDSIPREYNEIRKSMLKYIELPEDRKKVIGSMWSMVETSIQPYRDMVEKMIKEYFEDNGGLTPEKEENMEIVFKSMEVHYTNYENNATTGMCSYPNKTITIANSRRGKTLETLLDLTHEYSHAFSKTDWTRTTYDMCNAVEEGMADVLAEQVLNHYLGKHGSIEVGGTVISSDCMPVKSTSCYYFANGWTKSMLYPLEQEEKDVEAIKEYLFGSKKKFLDLTMGEEFSQRFETNHLNEPQNFGMTYRELYDAHPNEFMDIDKNSLYYQKNFILPAFIIQAKTEGRDPVHITDLGKMNFNEHYINIAYFNSRKLYEISPEEYVEFIDLYKRAKCPEYTFIEGLGEYAQMKFKELDEKEVLEHAEEISQIVATLTPVLEDSDISISEEMEKVMELVNSVSPREQEAQAASMSITANILLNNAEENKIRFGEVSALNYALEKDMEERNHDNNIGGER